MKIISQSESYLMIERIIVVLWMLFLCCSNLMSQELEGKSYAEIDSLIMTHYQNGAYEKTIVCTNFARKKARMEFGVKDSIYANYTANLGFFYHKRGEYEKAEAFYLETNAFFIAVYGKRNENYSTGLNNLASLYREIGQYEMAEPLFGEVLNIDKQLFGMKSLEYATGLNNLALLYLDQKRYVKAEPLLLRSMDIRKGIYGEKHPMYARALNNLAGLYTKMKRYKESASLYIEAQDINTIRLGKEHVSYANSMSNLASLYHLQEDYTKAEPLHLEALSIEEQALGKEHPQYINSLNKLGLLYYSMEQYDLTWSFLQQSIQIATQTNVSMNITEAWKDSLLQLDFDSYSMLHHTTNALELMYKVLGARGENNTRKKQVIVVDLALALLERGRNNFFNYKDKLRLLSESNNWILKRLALLDKSTESEKAFQIAEQNKSVLLMEAAQAQAAYQMGDLPDSLIQLEQQIIKRQNKIYNKLQDKRPLPEKDSLRILLNGLNTKRKAFKTRIERDFPKYTNLKYQQKHTKVSEIQALLKADEAMIEYVIGDSIVYILYLDQHTLRVVEQPLDKKLLKWEIKKMHQTLSDYKLLSSQEKEAYRSYTSSAHWFYQNLVAPILSPSKKIKKLIVITDGELGHLPFEVFLVEAAAQKQTDYADLHYLMNDYVFSYHYSATLWKENKEGVVPQNNGQVLGVAANYTTNVESSSNYTRLPAYQRIREDLGPLPNARKELKMLSKQFEGYFAFDNVASEKVFKEKSSEFAVIHLAMHGLLNSRAQMLSSLVFTEDGDSVENNFLQAYEISKLNLNANLVVLSACETGFGKFEKGNGIASLARSFMYAGASSLVVSLWQVNDFSTSEIMKFFYQNLAKDMDTAEALRAAKLEYMKKAKGVFKHPAFWSPFVQIGTSNAIYLELKSDRLPLWWWGLGVFGIVLLLVFWKKKGESNV
jgi:CHAT domain-containing protein